MNFSSPISCRKSETVFENKIQRLIVPVRIGRFSTMKKGYKVTDVHRLKKIGVAAENLEELIEKSCKKLGVSVVLLINLISLFAIRIISSIIIPTLGGNSCNILLLCP